MSTDSSFDFVMARLRSGDDEAAARVFSRFAGRLIALARSRLDTPTRQKVDPEDVVQSVYKSFFRRHAEGEFDLRDWDNLWTLLAVIAVRKCVNRVQHFRAARRDVHQETPPASDESDASWQVISREPTPEDAVLLTDTIEQLFRGLEPRNHEIVTLALQGYSTVEISERLGRARRTVQRVLEHVRERLQRWQTADTDAPA